MIYPNCHPFEPSPRMRESNLGVPSRSSGLVCGTGFLMGALSRERAMQSSITGIQFQVSDVELATQPMTAVPYSQAVAEFLDGPIESCSRYAGQLTPAPRTHPLLSAAHRASPD